MNTPSPLAARALKKLRAVAEGNGFDPARIVLLGADEKELTLKAEMHMALDLTFEKQRFAGPPQVTKGGPEAVMVNSPGEIASRAEEFRIRLSETSRWINEAVEQLKAQPGQGFGIEGADITLENVARIFRTTENCMDCGGAGARACEVCRGLGNVPCTQCHGSGHETCHHCQGRGTDPSDPQRYCSYCSGATLVPCRTCFGRRNLSCPTCVGRGRLTCHTCNGHAKFTVEEKAMPTIHCDLAIVDSGDLPSGLRRALDRGGLKSLLRLQAKVVMEPAQENEKKKAVIPYSATFPYAEARIKLGDKAVKATVLGARAAVRDIPPFLDPVFDKELTEIEKKIGASGALEKALKLRAMRDLFALLLQGEAEPEKALRRFYSFGLSSTMITRMKTLLAKLIQERTFMARAAASGFCLLVLGGVFYAIVGSNLRAMLAKATFMPAAFLFDGMILGASYFFVDTALRFSAATTLRNMTRGGERVSLRSQRSGSLGISVSVCAIFLYLALLWFLKATPGFFG